MNMAIYDTSSQFLKNLGARKMLQREFHIEDPQLRSDL
jgi:hypothetical protein